MNKLSLFAIPLLLASFAYAQNRVAPVDTRVAPVDTHVDTHVDATRQIPNPAAAATAAPADSDYVLGPGDQITILVPDLDDQFTTDKLFRVDLSGNLLVPFVGQIHAAGLTSEALAKQIEAGLKGKILKNPQVVVNITDFHSQPVSVFGEVNYPGLHQIQGGKSLFEALALAGGFGDNIGNTIQITRNLKWGRIPLPSAHDDPSGQFSVASLSVKSVLKASDPAANIRLMPDDVISVSKSEVVYAVGSVNKPGGFELGQNESLTSLQVLSLAQGLEKTAAPQRAMIFRVVPGSKGRTQIPVNVKELMKGSGTDVKLQADDILFIPNSKTKTVTYRALEAILQTTTGMATYGRY